MALTIKLDDDFISAEDLQLLKTKHAILDKLRVRFGEFAGRKERATAQGADANNPSQRSRPPG